MECVFWGVVDVQKDVLTAGGSINKIGQREYQAVDLLYYTTNKCKPQSIYRDSIKRKDSSFVYNASMNNIVGNKEKDCEFMLYDRNSVPFLHHSIVKKSMGDEWNAVEIVKNLICSNQKYGKIVNFDIVDDYGALTNLKPTFRPQADYSVWDNIISIIDFTAGRGVAFFDWETENGYPKTPMLRIKSIIEESKTEEALTLNSADLEEVILTGDQRNIEGAFQLGGVEDYKYDNVVSYGDKIQIITTLEAKWGETEIDEDSDLIPCWTADEEAEFTSAFDNEEHKNVFRLFKLRDKFTFKIESLPYITDVESDDIKILSHIPLFTGNDNIIGGNKKPFIMVKDGETYKKVNATIYIKDNEIWCGIVKNEDDTERIFKDTYKDLALTCCLELPVRMRFNEIDANLTKEVIYEDKKYIISLADTIIMANSSDNTTLEEDVIHRDDTDHIKADQFIRKQWNVENHRPCRWGLMACGLINNSQDTWLKLGDYVNEMNYAGMSDDINAPITSLIYDNRNGSTQWRTSYKEMD